MAPCKTVYTFPYFHNFRKSIPDIIDHRYLYRFLVLKRRGVIGAGELSSAYRAFVFSNTARFSFEEKCKQTSATKTFPNKFYPALYVLRLCLHRRRCKQQLTKHSIDTFLFYWHPFPRSRSILTSVREDICSDLRGKQRRRRWRMINKVKRNNTSSVLYNDGQ